MLFRVFFERKFDFSPSNANAVNSIVYVISAVASPFFGALVDRVGRNILWVFLAIVFTIGSHALLTFTFINPYVGMVNLFTNLLFYCTSSYLNSFVFLRRLPWASHIPC